jgi:hypothetical protein
MDYLQQLKANTGGKISKQDLFSQNFEHKSFRSLVIKDFENYKLRINDHNELCSIEIKLNVAFAFALNKPDKVLYFDTPLSLKEVPYTVYVSKSNIDLANDMNFVQACRLLAQFFQKLNPFPDEAVFVYRNAVIFALQTDRDLASILEQIIELISANNNIFKRTVRKIISAEKIPDHLQPLIPLIKKYSISDDSEREQLIEDMKKTEIKKLIEQVSPYMKDINTFLDSFIDQPLTEEATLIGNLAELVSELEFKKITYEL